MGGVCFRAEELDFDTQDVELDHFYLLRVIGKGAFGKVRLVQHKGTGQQYALKCISKSRCVELRSATNMIAERRLLERIEYPLIVNLRYAFQDENYLFMVLDLMLGGDLRFHLDRNGPLTEMQVRFYVAEIALSLGYLHKRRIVHRDLKPDNVLLDANGHAHLSDFNVATQLSEKRPLRWSKAGSLAYMAPEILSKKGYSTSVDWWSLGITAYELLFGKRPFQGSTNDKIIESILNDPLEFPANASKLASDECLDLISKLLERSPFLRLGCGPGGFEEFRQHPWFRGLDWMLLERKEATPPYTPNRDESNFDAVHELEELLLDEEPFRPRKRIPKPASVDMSNLTEEAQARLLMEEKFLSFDCTKQASWKKNRPPSDSTTIVDPLAPAAAAAATPTGPSAAAEGNDGETRLLRRIGGALNDHIDQAKYRSKGYIPAPSSADDYDETIDLDTTRRSKNV